MNKYVENTCKIGQGNKCCRYLIAGPLGFECTKHTIQAQILDLRVENNQITAQGDNCSGFSMRDSIKKLNLDEDE